MNIRISKLAQLEIDDAVVWFDSQSQGLGTRFLDDIDLIVSTAYYPKYLSSRDIINIKLYDRKA